MFVAVPAGRTTEEVALRARRSVLVASQVGSSVVLPEPTIVMRVSGPGMMPASKEQDFLVGVIDKLRSLYAAVRKAPPGREDVLRNRAFLRPGLYLYTGGTSYRHWRQSLPTHFGITKSRFLHRLRAKDGLGGFSRYVCLQAMSVLPSRLFWVFRVGKYSFPIISVRSDRFVMLDPERQLVGRALPPGYFGSDQTVMRKSYLKHVPCPAPIAIEDDRILIEEFIHGEHFDGLELTRKIDVCKVIYRCYADLVLNEGRRSSKTILDVLCDDKVLLNLHPEPRRRLRNLEERLPGIGNWPQVPTSPDSGSNNIIVARGEQPYFIDYLPLRLLPFFYTPVWVIAWSRDAGLRARYFEGEFDSELQVLFDAAGIAYAPNRETRETLVALTLLFKCVRYLGTLNGPHVSGRDRHDHVLIADKVNGYVAKCGLDKARSWC